MSPSDDRPDEPGDRTPEPPDDRSPLDPGRIVEEAREGVEHLVEGVREEVEELHEKIEDVVEEHLPRRARWKAGRIAWVILGSLVVLVALLLGGAALYVTRHTTWAAGELTRVINQTLAQHSNLVLEVRDLQGNPFKQVRLIEPRLRIRGKSTPPLLEAPSMSVAYAPWSLWLGRRRSIEITLDRPVLRLTLGPDGRPLWPEWKPGPRGTESPRELELLLHFRDGALRVPDTSLEIDGWNLDGRALTGRPSQIVIQRMTWRRGPWGSQLEALAGEVSVSDSVRFVIHEVRSPDLALRASGAWKAGGHNETRLVRLDVDRVRWAWLARVFDNGVFDVPGEGHGHVEARGDRDWRGHITAAGVWDSAQVAGAGDFAWAHRRVRVEPLVLTSEIGNLVGRLDYGSDDWELTGDVRRGDPARWRVFGLEGWPHGNLNGRMAFRNHRQGERHASRLGATLGASDLGGWAADSAWTTIDFPLAGADSFTVRMSRRGGSFTLLGSTGEHGWLGRYELARYPLDEWADGRKSGLRGLLASGRGTVEGRDDGLQVSGALEGVASEWLGLHTARWRLEGLRGRLLPTPDLAMSARLRDLQFLGVHFDSAAAQLHLGDQAVALDSVTAQAGDTVVTVAGRSTWDAGGWHIALARAAAESRQFHWTAEAPLELSGDPQGVTFDRFLAHDGDARLEFSGRWAAPGGRYDWTGRASRLDLGRIGLPIEWGLSGRSEVVLRVDGASGDPHWRLDASAGRPGMSHHRADTLEIALEGRKAELEVRRLRAGLDGGRLTGQMTFSRIAEPWPDTLTAQGVRAWLLGSGHWEGGLDADSLPLDNLDQFEPVARGWGGRVTGHLGVAGDPRHPELDLAAEARPIRRDSLVADLVRARASYRDGRLQVPEMRVQRGAALATISGSMPLRLDLVSRPEIPDQPMSWRLDIVKGELSMLPLLTPQIAQARGGVEASARIEGTTRAPTLDGAVQVRGGVMVPAGREEVLEDVYANLHLSRSRITLDTLYAREGRRGQVTGRGAIELDGSQLKGYRLELGLREFTIHEAGFYVALVGGQLVVTDGPRVNGHTLPMITGDIELTRGVIVFDFANAAEQERLAATTQPLLWTYRIHLLANNNLRWQPPDGDIEFSADLTLEQTPGALSMWGDMHALRGTYHFLSNRFTVNKADVTFDNVGGVNPVLDAEAVTRILPTQEPTAPQGPSATPESPQPHQVTVRITGRTDRPVIEFVTDPADWDEARVLQELTVGRFFDKGNVALGDPLDNYVTRKLNEQLDPLLSKAFLGYVNQWTLAREQGGVFYGKGELFVKVSSQVSPQLLVSYSQKLPGFTRPYPTGYSPVTGGLERNVEAEYRLNRFFYITTGYTQRRLLGTTINSGPLGGEFDLNLKARWEY
jgi:hypothetical protein